MAVREGNKTKSDNSFEAATKDDTDMQLRMAGALQKSMFSCKPDSSELFTVCAGIEADDALEWAGTFLDIADSLTHDAAMDMDASESPDCRRVWAASYMVNASKALIDFAISHRNR